MLLADGQVHSGQRLAGRLGISRAAVWKSVERLRELGIDVQSLARRGYRLPRPVELLETPRMLAELAPAAMPCLRRLELLLDVGSTNTRLLAQPPPPIGICDVCASELQHAGRGRRGRPWLAPFGSGVAMSVAWTFSDAARALPALSLGVGVAVVRALERAGAGDIALKWPNDIWFRDRKIGGVLIELRAEAGGPAHVVIGVGVNVSLAPEARQALEATGVRVAAVADACVAVPSRNAIAGAILDELLSMLAGFERAGFAPFRDAWLKLDGLRGRRVRVSGDTGVAGIARGADLDGALLLEVDGSTQRIVSGEASLRLAEGDI